MFKNELCILLHVMNKEIFYDEICYLENGLPIYISETVFKKCKEYFSRNKESIEYQIFDYIEEFKEMLLANYDMDSKLVLGLNIVKTRSDYYCEYSFFPESLEGKSKTYKDQNIIHNSYPTAFQFLLEDIKKYSQKENKSMNNKNPSPDKKKEMINQENKVKDINNITVAINSQTFQQNTTSIYYDKSANQYEILCFIKVIGSHREKGKIHTAEFIKELKYSNCYISGGTDERLKIYSLNFNILSNNEVTEIKDWTYDIFERGHKSFFACANKFLYVFNFDKDDNLKFSSYELNNITCMSATEIEMKVKENDKEKKQEKPKKKI